MMAAFTELALEACISEYCSERILHECFGELVELQEARRDKTAYDRVSVNND